MAETKEYTNILSLFKQDIGISHTQRDAYFLKHIEAQEAELNRKGIILDLNNADDMMLLSDYAAWNYRNRDKDVVLARNIDLRIKNRVVRNRSKQ